MVAALNEIAEETEIPRARLIMLAVRDAVHRHRRALDSHHREQFQ